jgi:hypothetical protein
MAKYLDLSGLTHFWNAFKSRLLPSGGSTGQVLAKSSATNYNVAWVNPTAELPTVTTSDNGKVLMVVGGTWAAASLPVYDGTVE